MIETEIRASQITEGKYFREYGMDDVHLARFITGRGDALLIDCAEGCEVTLDGDTVVELMDYAPVNIAGQVTLANGRSIHFRIGNVAGGITYTQWGETEPVLYQTVGLMEGLVKAINDDNLVHVVHD
jgi:hypothetical protein